MKLFTLAATLLLIGAIAILSSVTLQASHDAGGGSAGAISQATDISVSSDPAGHETFIGMPDKLDLSILTDGPNISVTGADPWVSVQGTVEGGEVFAEGVGTVAGNQNIAVLLQGTFVGDELAGTYTMGYDTGENPLLPNDQPIIYDLQPQAPPKLFTITVLKRNDATKQGLPGWEINLYPGTGCTGNSIDSGTTGSDGLLEFTGLQAGTYSVNEKLQAGWNNVTDLCQDATVPGAAGAAAGLPACPVQPNEEFPDPGCDEFNSVATVQVVFTNPPIDELECDLSGPTQITRGPVVSKPPDSIDTEIVAMELTGTCRPGSITVTVRESPTQASTGRIVEQIDVTTGELDFPADSFFDVFFEIDTPLGTLHNQTALRLECKISQIPPFGCLYEPDVGVIPLFDETKKEVGAMLHAAHLPVDPNKVLVIFSNVPGPTPPGSGDVNGDGTTNTIDATLILQFDAGLITTLLNPDNGDVNLDIRTNTIDAQLILQFDAGLIDVLPLPIQ